MRELQNLHEIYDLITELNKQQPSSKTDLISFFRTNKKCRIIDSHSTLSIIVVFSGITIRHALKVECGRDSATTRELHWYKQYLLPGIESSFIEGGIFEHFSYIIMKYIDDLVSLADVIFEDKTQLKPIAEWIDTAFKADLQLFDLTRQYRSPRMQYLDVCNKFRARMREASQFPFLGALIGCEFININGEACLSPQKILTDIYSTQGFIEKLFTSDIGVIHGDLHIGNIVHSTSPQGELFVFDPGSVNLLPIQYDGGKILQSTHSGYEQIMRGQYLMTFIGDNSYSLNVNDIGDFNSTYAYLRQSWDANLLLGSLFMEAMHFLTMTSHHASNRSEAIALYLTGVRLLNDLINTLKSE